MRDSLYTQVNQLYSSYTGRTVQDRATLSYSIWCTKIQQSIVRRMEGSDWSAVGRFSNDFILSQQQYSECLYKIKTLSQMDTVAKVYVWLLFHAYCTYIVASAPSVTQARFLCGDSVYIMYSITFLFGNP